MTSHAADLELARLCADGDERAWERFILEYRPVLYRAADALDPSGGARDLADSLYADLYGIKEREGERQSLFRYYQGRSSLATWLRAVLSQRYIDRLRAERRVEPLADETDRPLEVPASLMSTPPDPDRPRLVALVRDILIRAIARLSDRDRLRLGCYYVQELTLAAIGRLLQEHEATASRQLARTRRWLRDEVERELRDVHGFGADQIAQCLAAVTEDPGALDLEPLLGSSGERKKPVPNRSV